MSEINDELIQKARNADLADYFLRNGYDCEMKSKNELHVKGHGGLFVNTQTNKWYCFSQAGDSRGGGNPVNCLTDVLGFDFKTAVEHLSGGRLIYERKQNAEAPLPEKKRELVLPEKSEDMKKVFAYLCKTRMIKPDIVTELAKSGLLYQDKKGNAVFVHKDDSGKIIGAEIQGTNSFQRFKGVAPGTSESVFTFKLCDKPNSCYVFESAIDLLSFKQLANPEKIKNSMLVSMAGLKPNTLKNLAESGVKLYSCVDNDEAGIKFTQSNGLTPCRKILEENGVKDYNDLLKSLTAKTQQQTQTAPRKNSHSHR